MHGSSLASIGGATSWIGPPPRHAVPTWKFGLTYIDRGNM